MALADYIKCDKCNAKVVYDGDDTIMDALEKLDLDGAPVLCETCRKSWRVTFTCTPIPQQTE